MKNWGMTACCCFLILSLMTVCSQKTSCAAGELQQNRLNIYRPIAVEKAGDIAQLEALIGDFSAAWNRYTNDGDPGVFRYMKNAGKLSDPMITKVGKGSISYVSANIYSIKFADSAKKAYVYVWGNISVKSTENGDTHYYPSEYSWIYEAEIEDNHWVLNKCTPDVKVHDRSSYSNPRSLFINNTEFLIGDRVFFANPKDAGKLYWSTLSGKEFNKILDDSVSIVELAFPRNIVYINKTRNNEVWLLNSRNLSTKNAVMEFPDKDGSYFTDGYAIFRAGDKGSSFQRIYSRAMAERSELTLINVSGGWLYFFYFSEGGKRNYRVKTDGTATELLSEIKVDWRDEDY